ncbi:hypothetical protein D8Q86_21525 [Salmonella enterica subsp. enterica serovar Reading]|nr:hypothetical protein [Salmonella enterica]EBS1405133.1 hypothetical protein [Salmonella enterica subsp. enterica serovar Reading]
MACKAQENWLKFIHNPDELSGEILTPVYINGSLQHIFCIIQLIVHQLQLIIIHATAYVIMLLAQF